MDERIHLAWAAQMVLRQYRREAAVLGPVPAASRVVHAVREYLAMRDDTAIHPGARRLAAWLWAARRAGDLSGFEARVAEFLQPQGDAR